MRCVASFLCYAAPDLSVECRLSPKRAIFFKNKDEDAYLSVGSSDLLHSSVEPLPSLRELRRLPSTPVMSVKAEYIFLETTGDEDIRDMSYSETFTAGLWAQVRELQPCCSSSSNSCP